MDQPKSEPFVEAYEQLEGPGFRGYETGFYELDDMLTGLHSHDFIIVGSRTRMGKTSFASNVSTALAGASHPVSFISLSETRQLISQRMIASRSQIDGQRMRKSLLRAQEYLRAAITTNELEQLPLRIHSVPGIHIDLLCDLIVEERDKHGTKLAVVDYLQLIDATEQNETERISVVSRRLKTLSTKTGITIIGLSDLVRFENYRTEYNRRRPMTSDLRGSGSLEADADVVILLHREDLYCETEPDFVPDHRTEVIIAKQRNGPTGTVILTFDSKTQTFKNFATQVDLV